MKKFRFLIVLLVASIFLTSCKPLDLYEEYMSYVMEAYHKGKEIKVAEEKKKKEEAKKDKEHKEDKKDEIIEEPDIKEDDQVDNDEEDSNQPQPAKKDEENQEEIPDEGNTDSDLGDDSDQEEGLEDSTSDEQEPIDDQEKDQEDNLREEEVPDGVEVEPSAIYLDGNFVNYLDIGISNYDVEKTQSYIDQGNVISTVTKFSAYDNEVTYFAGHTYSFGPIAKLEIGSIVKISDQNSNLYSYEIVDYKKYRAGTVEGSAPFIGGYHLSDLAGQGIGVESIVIQYCDVDDIPLIFFGLPK